MCGLHVWSGSPWRSRSRPNWQISGLRRLPMMTCGQTTWSSPTASLTPAHLLLNSDGAIEAVLDSTTAKVSDPALDFMYHFMHSSGRVPRHLPERCAVILDAGPLNYGVYALTTGDPAHAAEAVSQLNPAPMTP